MQPRSFIQATPSFSRKGRLRDTASRTAVSLTCAGSSAQTVALRAPKQNRVAKITRVMLDLTCLTVAHPSLENRRPSCVPWLSTIKRFTDSLPPFNGTVNPMSSNGQLDLWRFGYAIANTGYPDRLEPVLYHDHLIEPTQVPPARGRRGRAPHEVGVRTRGHRDR